MDKQAHEADHLRPGMTQVVNQADKPEGVLWYGTDSEGETHAWTPKEVTFVEWKPAKVVEA